MDDGPQTAKYSFRGTTEERTPPLTPPQILRIWRGEKQGFWEGD